MLLRTAALLLLSLLLFTGTACGQMEDPDLTGTNFMLEPAFPNLSFSAPVDLQHPGDDSNRLFVVEQQGRIRVFDNDRDVASASLFLDITDRVLSGGEQGLLGLAFHPDFESNGFFFVNYTASNPRRTVVSRFEVDATDPNQGDPASESVLLEVGQPFGNHNGGQIRFGPDGFLYIALGDGGSGGDPQEHGQNPTTLLGAILRIDVDTPDAGRNYGIPADNPFAGNTQGFREEIYAYGLRNPWRFSFDVQTGTLWTGDVGQRSFEEIDIIEAGGNYGWNTMEGFSCFDPPSNCDQTGLTLPVHDYCRTEGQSVTGGFVYRGPSVPELVGKYIYGDFGSGRIWALGFDGNRATDNTELLDTNLGIAAFGTDANNELYVCAFDGSIYRFTPTISVSSKALPAAPTHRLLAGYPNPFRSSATVGYALARPSNVEMAIYDALGRQVATLVRGMQPSGSHTLTWNGLNDNGMHLPGGVYFYRLSADGAFIAARQLLLAR